MNYRLMSAGGRAAAIATACLALMVVAHAQDDDSLSGRASLGYLATSGNTESTNTNARLRLRFEPNVWSHEWDLSAVGATRDRETTTESYTGLYVARRSWGRSYMFGALDWNKNRFAAYLRQRSESVGYGRRVIEGDSHELNIEGGLGARFARSADGTTSDEGIVRAALDYEWTLNSTTSFSQDLTIESGESNTRTESVSALRARLIGGIALVVSYRVRHDSDVPVGRVRSDRFTSISLEYAF
jgi:putative salt-induced outer membrane protein